MTEVQDSFFTSAWNSPLRGFILSSKVQGKKMLMQYNRFQKGVFVFLFFDKRKDWATPAESTVLTYISVTDRADENVTGQSKRPRKKKIKRVPYAADVPPAPEGFDKFTCHKVF